MHNLFLIMIATSTIFIDWVHMTLPKLHVKFKPLPLTVSKIGVWSLLYSKNEIFPEHAVFARC